MSKKGFTLVELIVAVFIFSVLMVIAVGSFVSALSLQRRALNIKKVEENSRFILELMAREIRVANPINTTDNGCPGSGTSILTFQHPVNGLIEYSLSGNQVHRKVDGADSIISNPDIEVSRLTFCVSGNAVSDDRQPRVTIILSLKTGGAAAEKANIDLQTTASQRVLSD
ncbi:MAG: prepilin-type N-terminal cleavage/methylation domain-containing protein [Patescibacteria group bacterium]